ncbi:circularly permuted type 2 ATP-grasp protein [Accumulibacter sp.]|uniref:circularly permuted type 2 ATP-grasp protein n=1 Tax=Accumulibacter sp. TaxID=2053492 RepID=UPI00287AD5A6|nr:circularly permuted type 2 ATP-grasp protein [Accumulibacter sp.]MDS4056774.1 circularly permuted type 2 ATP-grasp protein [Accumulibacter sp.]
MPRSLLASYPKQGDRFDEMLDQDGVVRPAWRAFLGHLDAASGEQMRHRCADLHRRIVENGVTYNVYADPKGADRPWELDLLPLILPAAEWQQLAAAVSQRARLLNAVLQDLYGPQELLRDGSLPPALVYGHNNFLWPCRGTRPPGDVFLHLYAADLARSPDGRWWVIADRTQAPSGAGYALENRTIVGRVFPDLFRDLQVQHLASFFRDLQESLAAFAPQSNEAPLIVLLTPGAYNETYFEHAYLARYLGFPLVEGQDLTVRGDCVYLKTLSGLRRVHAILRRLDDDFCDPLELRADSALGVAGLLQAVRAGKVLVANALGSGLLESAALPGFLPGACVKLLGEELAMPSVATWWCGEQAALEFTIAHLDRLVIKGSYPSQKFDPVFGNQLSSRRRAEMIARLRARPQAYVAQELVNFSRAPAWSKQHDRRLLARGVGLRVFVAATPSGHVVMPGGLTRVAAVSNARIISMQRGGSSKDTWVLAEGAVNPFSLLKHTVGKADLVRGGYNLSSRIVENLYWFGRYSERCDKTARLLRAGLSRLLDSGADASRALLAAFDLCQALQIVPAADAAAQPAEPSLPATAGAAHQVLLVQAICGKQWGDGLAGDIRRLLWVATQVRERFSLDNWHAINRLQHQLQCYAQAAGDAQQVELSDALAFLDQVLLAASSLAGFAMDNMTRDDGWRFLIIGRRLERLAFLAASLGQYLRLPAASAAANLEWLLELTDSIITYRSRYMARAQILPALDLIVFDDANPHSVAFQIDVLARDLDKLAHLLGGPADPALHSARQRLQAFDVGRFEADDAREADAARDLAALLADLALAAAALSDRLTMRYFSHVGGISHHTLAW